FVKDDQGQGLPTFAQSAIAHLQSHQQEQMFGQSSSPGDGVVKDNGHQQLATTQIVSRAASLVFAGLQPFEILPAYSFEQQADKAAAVLRDLPEADASWGTQPRSFGPAPLLPFNGSIGGSWMLLHPTLFKHLFSKYQAKIAYLI